MTISRSPAHEAVLLIRQKKPNFIPKIGLILGSGLGDVAKQITDVTIIPYSTIPGFPICRVEGHAGQMFLGKLQGVPIVCLQGRAHWYEGTSSTVIQTLIRTLKLLGCEFLILTNSSGSLRPELTPGNLMEITDHINLQGKNPLVGENDDEFGPRFVPMENAYDLELRTILQATAKKLQIPLAQGIYLGVLGPSFETPAEIRYFQTMGCSALGMSTVPEVIVARHCDLKVVGISLITNFAAGLSSDAVTHDRTLSGAKLGLANLIRLLIAFVENFGHEHS
jgi:xanthosine phosphorylase